jgi:hypothetical protein
MAVANFYNNNKKYSKFSNVSVSKVSRKLERVSLLTNSLR